MLNRLPSALGLALAAFAATTGVSSAAIDTRSEVMYLAGATVVALLILVSIAAAVKHALGLDKMAPPEAGESFGHSAAHDDHDSDAGADHDDHGAQHGAPAAEGAHH